MDSSIDRITIIAFKRILIFNIIRSSCQPEVINLVQGFYTKNSEMYYNSGNCLILKEALYGDV